MENCVWGGGSNDISPAVWGFSVAVVLLEWQGTQRQAISCPSRRFLPVHDRLPQFPARRAQSGNPC